MPLNLQKEVTIENWCTVAVDDQHMMQRKAAVEDQCM